VVPAGSHQVVKTETTSPKSESSIKDESEDIVVVEAVGPSAVQPKVEPRAVKEPPIESDDSLKSDESLVKSDESSLKSEESSVKSEHLLVKEEVVGVEGVGDAEAACGETGGGVGGEGESIPQPLIQMPSLEESA
jgi:hypothetical protein